MISPNQNNWKYTRKGLLKKIQDKPSRCFGCQEINKPIVETILQDTLYFRYRTNSVQFLVAEINAKQKWAFVKGRCDRTIYFHFELLLIYKKIKVGFFKHPVCHPEVYSNYLSNVSNKWNCKKHCFVKIFQKNLFHKNDIALRKMVMI